MFLSIVFSSIVSSSIKMENQDLKISRLSDQELGFDAIPYITDPMVKSICNYSFYGEFSSCPYIVAGGRLSLLNSKELPRDWNSAPELALGWQASAGYHFTEKLFTELAYIQGGEMPVHSAGKLVSSIKYNAYQLDAGYFFLKPIPDLTFNPYIKAGFGYIDNSVKNNAFNYRQKRKVQLVWTGGVQWRPQGSSWFFRGELSSFNSEFIGLNMMVGHYFGYLLK
ncbi:porin family protein [Vibrio sp. SS-MA-C1-2]|uniref:outer membrane beta-barrel protein n=1 Tax=Vibrio sp. SS-MA-C1-2 TaxID=2908646 RepID=UPI001F2752BD|nr:outer membrane beta-barrel protein [Vibrio sp. SS-MA-C1-2]UJF17685.1 porin family protein [Vibrio sp. SS-MA-C1-2]